MYEKSVLANGVRVVTGPMTGVRSASLIFYYGVGSRYERPEHAGHLPLPGAHALQGHREAARPDADLPGDRGRRRHSQRRHRPRGDELLVQGARAPTSPWPSTCWPTSSATRSSTPAELDKERSVIFEEIRSVQDSPEDLVHDVIDEVVWGDQGVGRSIAGTEETVGAIDRAAMVDFWQRNYSPDRLVVAAGGDIAHDEVVALTERYFGDLAADVRGRRLRAVTVDDQTGAARAPRRARDRAGAPLPRDAGAALHRPSAATCSRRSRRSSPPGMSSRLFQEIREKRGLVYSVYGYFRPYADVGQGVVYAGTDLERVEETIDAIVEELRKLRDERVPEDELQRTKELRKGRLLMGLEDSRSVAAWIGSQEADLRRDQDPGRGDGEDRRRHRRARCRSWRGALPRRPAQPGPGRPLRRPATLRRPVDACDERRRQPSSPRRRSRRSTRPLDDGEAAALLADCRIRSATRTRRGRCWQPRVRTRHASLLGVGSTASWSASTCSGGCTMANEIRRPRRGTRPTGGAASARCASTTRSCGRASGRWWWRRTKRRWPFFKACGFKLVGKRKGPDGVAALPARLARADPETRRGRRRPSVERRAGLATGWEAIVDLALAEDIGTGDVTTLATVPAGARAPAAYDARQGRGRRSPGSTAAAYTFDRVDPAVRFTPSVADGARVQTPAT